MRRRALLGMAGLGAVAAVGGGTAAAQDTEENEYATRVRPIAAVGLGKGQGASLSVVWLPRKGYDQLPPRFVELAIFDLSGNKVAAKQTQLLPFAGASIDVVHHKADRRSLYGYVFIDEPFDDIFTGLEIYDVSTGRTKLSFPVTVP